MANIVRLRGLQSLLSRVSSSTSSPKSSSTGSLLLTARNRFVGTSSTQKSGAEAKSCDAVATGQNAIPGTKPNCWVSYGFSDENQWEDRHFHHVTSLVVISLVLVTGGWVLMYMPDNRYRDWAQREAYLELRRREAAGLPPIDPDVIDPAKVKLPPDEILTDEDIWI